MHLQEQVAGKPDLDVCPMCLLPRDMEEFNDMHRDTELHERFASNLKSALGVFLFRRQPYGLRSWADLVTKLNSSRRVAQVSSGQLLADLDDYLTIYLGCEVTYGDVVRMSTPRIYGTMKAEEAEKARGIV